MTNRTEALKQRKIRNCKAAVSDTAYYFVLIVFAAFFLLPFIVLFGRSFFTDSEIGSINAGLFPKEGWDISNYAKALDADFIRYFGNTIIVIVFNVIGRPLTAAMAAYAFVRVKFRGRKFWFALAMGTMMLPGMLVMIPVYKIYVDLHWTNTLLPLILPAFLGGGFVNIFLIMQFLRGIPKEVEESAIIDGASTWTRMFKIVFPLIKPVLLLVAVQSFFTCWNDFTGPLMYISDESLLTLPVGLYNKFFTGLTFADSMPNVQMASGVIVLIPPLIIFSFFQKSLVEGVAFTGIKG